MQPKNIKIAFVHLAPEEMASFVRKDYEILKKRYAVRTYFYKAFLRSYWDAFKIMLEMFSADIGFTKFAYRQAYYMVKFAKIFRKKSVVVLGGFDVLPQDGGLREFSRKRVRMLRYILDNADVVLSNSEYLKNAAAQFTARTDIHLTPDGFDTNWFSPGRFEKEHLALTVGWLTNWNLRRKGIETFVRAAKYLPTVRFVVVGPVEEAAALRKLKHIATPNVEFTGYIADEKLLEYMQKAKVYVQVSASEGFGCALAEAMLCECVPVVTSRGALPEVVGGTGYYVPYGDPKATAEAIKKALADSEKGKLARERIKTFFPIQKREKHLVEIIEKLIRNRGGNSVFKTIQSVKHFREKDIGWWKREDISYDYPLFENLMSEKIRNILEIGPGRGAFTFRMRDMGKHVVAIDVNPAFIACCRKKADCTNIEFVEGNAEYLPFRRESFDAVVCIEVLAHLPDTQKAFREMTMVTKRKGLIFVTFLKKYSKYYFKRMFTVLTGIYTRKYGKGSFDYKFHSLSEIKKYIKNAGLIVKKAYSIDSENPAILLQRIDD